MNNIKAETHERRILENFLKQDLKNNWIDHSITNINFEFNKKKLHKISYNLKDSIGGEKNINYITNSSCIPFELFESLRKQKEKQNYKIFKYITFHCFENKTMKKENRFQNVMAFECKFSNKKIISFETDVISDDFEIINIFQNFLNFFVNFENSVILNKKTHTKLNFSNQFSQRQEYELKLIKLAGFINFNFLI